MAKMRGVLVILLLIALVNAQEDLEFHPDFKFGVATSAYQIEGRGADDGKGMDIWDWITQTKPSFIINEEHAEIACDAYNKGTEDVALIKELGVNYYQFSISWSRLFPTGHVNEQNDEGFQYYDDLIDALISEEITPIITMFHWDLPLSMHELGGWPNPKLADYFVSYADKLFELFGDKVKYWITFSEPFQFCNDGYSSGDLAPGYAQDGIGGYWCSYTVLLAHAKAFRLYNDVYRESQGGQIGISLDGIWFEPEDADSPDDQAAAERSLEMMLGWFAHPIFSSAGDYPAVMIDRIETEREAEGFARPRLPVLTPEEVGLIRGSADFFGLSHYTSAICRPAGPGEFNSVTYNNDVGSHCDQPAEWETSASSWLKVHPEGLRKLLNWIRTNYGNKPVFITQNGFSDIGELDDCRRVNYLNSYLQEVLKAINEGCNVVAYTAWSLMDSFQWTRGYTEKFGLYHVNFEESDRPRTSKMSAKVYANIIANRKIDFNYVPEGYACKTFPDGFRFGVATSAYQVEGAHEEDGKGPSIWDELTHSRPELILDGENGDMACNAYHNTAGDVQLLKDLGVNFYRFSISWPRILPTGHVNNVNQDGIVYYNELIDELLANGIEPMVTMYHWDLPQALQEIGGWPNIMLADLFVDYAKLLFDNFGDRVKEWITFNEPHQICAFGYSSGKLAPAYTQDGVGGYLCGHTVLLAHAKTYKYYKDELSGTPTGDGKVGIAVHGMWSYPAGELQEDIDIADTNIQMHFGWFLHPIYSPSGDYPPVMKNNINRISQEIGFPTERLPEFTPDEITMLRGSSDFLGFNHYTSTICSATGTDDFPELSHDADTGAYCSQDDITWEGSATSWLKVVPDGFRKMLVWIKENYGDLPVIVTENGYSDSGLDIDDLQDCNRVEYHNSYLEALLDAIHEDGCNVIGYTAWSFMDNFEWTSGYTEKFGLYHVDFEDPDRTRTPKMSAGVFNNIIATRRINRYFAPPGFSACPSNLKKGRK